MQKPSFTSSLIAGAVGFAEGLLVLGLVGAIAGGGVGAILGATGLLAGEILGGAMVGAINTGLIAASIGATVGPIVGVIQHRESASVDTQDVINVANIAFAQGMASCKNQNVSEKSANNVLESADKFQKQLAAEKDCGCQTASR